MTWYTMHIIAGNQELSALSHVSSFIQWDAKKTAVAENSSMTCFKNSRKNTRNSGADDIIQQRYYFDFLLPVPQITNELYHVQGT